MAEQQNLDTACVLFWTPMPHCSDVYFHEQERLPEIYHAAGVVCSRVCETICSWGIIIIFLCICCTAVFVSFPELCCLKTGSIVWYFVIPQRTSFVTCGASEHAFDMNNKKKRKKWRGCWLWVSMTDWAVPVLLIYMSIYMYTHTYTHTHRIIYHCMSMKTFCWIGFFFSQRCCLLFHSWKKKKFHLILESIDEM